MDGRIALAYAKRLYDLAEGPQGPQGEPGSGAVGTVAEAYSTSKTYAVGDYVIHDEEFYRCTTAITTAEAFNSAHWTKLVLTDEVSDLKSDLNEVTENFEIVQSDNIFNKQTVTANKGIHADGTEITNSSYGVSDFIPVSAGDVVKGYYLSGDTVYDANMRYITCYDASKDVVPSAGSSTSVHIFTVPSDIAYIRITNYSALIDTFMLIANGSAPIQYIEYLRKFVASTDFIKKAVDELECVQGVVTKEDTDFWHLERSANLFDKNNVISGEFFYTNGAIGETANVFRSYVELNGAGTYSLKVMGNFYGLTNAVKIPTFDKDKVFVKTITGSTSETTASAANLMTLVISSQDIDDGVMYLGYSENPSEINSLMVVKSGTYPNDYIPYKETWTLLDLSLDAENNPLYGKIAVFDGDSICAGLGSAMGDYGNGWAGRIGVDNNMEYYNVGESGACITAETYFGGGSPRHWVSRYIDTIYANHPDADYVIGEGGTNDADNFYGDAEKLGTFSETDFTGPFDDTTFYGAMDSWCKKALTYFPKAKVGFIVAHKMGTGFITYVKNRYDYFKYASKVCKKWGIPVLNLWDEGQLRPDVVSMYDPNYNTIETATAQGLPYYDGQHLTAYGYDVISPKIEAWMKTL